MKKTLVVLSLALCSQFSHAQLSERYQSPDRFFNEGKEMFLDNNYVGAVHSLTEFRKLSHDSKLNMEADYMIVSSLFFRGNDHAENALKEFLETYPETYHRNEIAFYIGTSHFEKKEWEKALFWFKQSDIDYLNIKDQEDYSFRLAYSSLQNGDRTTAKQYFGSLERNNSKKYSEPSKYYLAYINFQEGNCDAALPVFEQLKNKSEYREEALFFLTQGYFIKNDLNKTVAEGNSYTQSYPNSKNAKEIYRMLGNSYNRLGNINSSITNYEKYLQLEDKPFREDMFLLGSSYYQQGNSAKAIDALKHAASTSDKLGQSAYMLLGQSFLKTNDTANALMAFDAASRSQFDSSISESALYNYAILVHQTSLSVFDQSITALQRFLREYPNSKYANQVNDILASTFLSTKNYSAALSAINEIRNPGKQILEAKQVTLFRLGTQEFINSNYQAASSNFDACINMGNFAPKAKNESYFWKAEMAYRSGNYSAAARDYQTYISQATSNDENYSLALYNLGYTYFQLKQYNNARPNFQKYVAQETDRNKPTYADALNRIGDCYLYGRNYSEAEKFYAQAVSNNPQDADYAEFQKAFVMGLQRNYAGKISALDNMISRYPNSQYVDDALFEKSRALVMLNRENEAISVLEKLTSSYPQSPLNSQAGAQLGQLYFNTGNHQKAITAYKQVINNYPKSEEARISIKSLEGVYKDINDINSYASYVNSLGVGTVITTSRQDSLSFLAAENVYMKGQGTNAKNAMKNYLQSYPNGAYASDAHYLLGYMAMESKDQNTALSEFDYVIKSNNRKYIDDALIYVSGIHYDNKNYQAALEAYNKLNNTASNNDNKNTAQLGILRSASILKDDAKVVSSATALLASSKTSPEIAAEARYYRAKSLLNLKKTDEAIADLQILAKDPRTVFGAEAQYILADTFFKWKSYDKAIKQVQSFMKQGTPHEYWMAKSLIVLSDCYTAQGDNFQAKQYLESLKANYKGNETDITNAINERLNK